MKIRPEPGDYIEYTEGRYLYRVLDAHHTVLIETDHDDDLWHPGDIEKDHNCLRLRDGEHHLIPREEGTRRELIAHLEGRWQGTRKPFSGP